MVNSITIAAYVLGVIITAYMGYFTLSRMKNVKREYVVLLMFTFSSINPALRVYLFSSVTVTSMPLCKLKPLLLSMVIGTPASEPLTTSVTSWS